METPEVTEATVEVNPEEEALDSPEIENIVEVETSQDETNVTADSKAGNIPIDEAHFPDFYFRSYIRSKLCFLN